MFTYSNFLQNNFTFLDPQYLIQDNDGITTLDTNDPTENKTPFEFGFTETTTQINPTNKSEKTLSEDSFLKAEINSDDDKKKDEYNLLVYALMANNSTASPARDNILPKKNETFDDDTITILNTIQSKSIPEKKTPISEIDLPFIDNNIPNKVPNNIQIEKDSLKLFNTEDLPPSPFIQSQNNFDDLPDKNNIDYTTFNKTQKNELFTKFSEENIIVNPDSKNQDNIKIQVEFLENQEQIKNDKQNNLHIKQEKTQIKGADFLNNLINQLDPLKENDEIYKKDSLNNQINNNDKTDTPELNKTQTSPSTDQFLTKASANTTLQNPSTINKINETITSNNTNTDKNENTTFSKTNKSNELNLKNASKKDQINNLNYSVLDENNPSSLNVTKNNSLLKDTLEDQKQDKKENNENKNIFNDKLINSQKGVPIVVDKNSQSDFSSPLVTTAMRRAVDLSSQLQARQGGTARLQIQDDKMGKIELTIHIDKKNSVNMEIKTSSRDTKEQLENSSELLKKSLDSQNMTLSNFKVVSTDQNNQISSSNNTNGFLSQQNNSQHNHQNNSEQNMQNQNNQTFNYNGFQNNFTNNGGNQQYFNNNEKDLISQNYNNSIAQNTRNFLNKNEKIPATNIKRGENGSIKVSV